MITRMTPILLVEMIEPCLPFWTEQFGFQVTMSVPGDDGRMVFAAIERDGFELMYQTAASAQEGIPGAHPAGSVLYLEVDDVAPFATAAKAEQVVKPLHTAPYGSQEIYLREPGGNVIGFAQPAPQD